MKLPQFLLMFFVLALFPADAIAQRANIKAAHIGYFGIEKGTKVEDAFLQGLREHGWHEGKTIKINRRYWEYRGERLAPLAKELVALKPDLIVASSGFGARALSQATTTIPIVMMASSDAVAQRLAASLAHPGGNVTGMTNISPDVAGKRLELLKEAFPKVARVACLRCPSGQAEWNEAEAAARVLKLQLQSLEIHKPDEIEPALQRAKRERTDAIYVFDCTFIPSAKTVEQIAKTGRPAMYSVSRFTDAGGLMSYAPDLSVLALRAATYVDKILKGTKAADLPIEQPMKFNLVISLKTAKQMGLTVAPNLLARADTVLR